MQRSHLYELILTALMTAVICVLAPLSLPVGPVPVSLCTFAIILAAIVLGWKRSVISVLVYMLLGAIGVPVFAGYSAGAAALVGPTGGYLLGYLPLAVLTGWFADHYSDIFSLVVGMVLGTAILYALGTLWLAKQLQMSFREGLAAGVIPFIPGDAAKIVITVLLGPLLKNTLKKAGYMIR